MPKAKNGKIEHNIEQHLKAFKQLADKRTAVEKRLETAVREKASVKASIFKKVTREYRDKLDEIDLEIYPLAEVATEALIGITKDHETIESTMRVVQDEIDEHAFRHKVGEFDDEEFENATSTLRVQMDDLENKRDELSRTIEKLEEIVSAGTPKADPLDPEILAEEQQPDVPEEAEPEDDAAVEEEPAAEPVSATEQPQPLEPNTLGSTPSPAGSEAQTSAERASTATAESGTINTNEWVQEFFAEEKTQGTSPQPAKAPPATEKPAASATFPILVVTRGAGAGKRLPLVPMTMTIGREHDNNIELKDEDVARYHARISYERGHYILQDLESSSGTWVNDEKISEAQLNHGDKILVGSTELLVDFPQ